MLRVALTGGIATGKSYVLDRLGRRGVPCLDADTLAHGTMVPGGEVTDAIARRFGSRILDATGAVDRQALGAIVFEDESARRDLEAIVHPAVYRAVAVGIKALARSEQPPLVVVAVPLLYETGRERDFDRVIATICRPDLQLVRLIERGLGEADARRRIAAQFPAGDKAARADYVVRTDGTFADSDRQIDETLTLLLR